jgi:hypothetical protein
MYVSIWAMMPMKYCERGKFNREYEKHLFGNQKKMEGSIMH